MRLTPQARIQRWAERLRASLWFIPAAMIAAAVLAAIVTLRIEREHGDVLGRVSPVFTATHEGVRAALSAIASSVMTVAGLSFSITIIVLQLASTEYSPRVIRGFLRDRVIQVVLGTYIATFVYVLLVLQAAPSEAEPVHSLSLAVSVVLGVTAMVLLVVFVHHVAQSIELPTIVHHIARETREAIDDLDWQSSDHDAYEEQRRVESEGAPGLVRAPTDGYIELVDEEYLCQLPGPMLLRIERHVGDYVPKGEVLARFWPASEPRAREILAAVSLSHERTVRQDIGFGLRMISDVALRALSPAVNDPTTAVHCVNVLGDLLRRLALRGFPTRVRTFEDGRRIELPRPAYGDLLRASFEQIAIYGRRDPRVAETILRALIGIAEVDGEGDHGRILAEVGDHVVEQLPGEWLTATREHVLALRSELSRALERPRTDRAVAPRG